MSISVTLEYWNEAPDPQGVHVITHNRKKFYNSKTVNWYEFVMDGLQLHELGHENIIPDGFLRVADTNYYEFGGSDAEARKSLTDANFTLIVEGDDL